MNIKRRDYNRALLDLYELEQEMHLQAMQDIHDALNKDFAEAEAKRKTTLIEEH